MGRTSFVNVTRSAEMGSTEVCCAHADPEATLIATAATSGKTTAQRLLVNGIRILSFISMVSTRSGGYG